MSITTARPRGPRVIFTASASGGSAGAYEYQYLLSVNGGPFSVAKPYGAAPSFTWTDTGAAGKYFFRVNARQAESTGPAEGTKAVTYVLALAPPVSPATGVILNAPSLASPQAPGASVTWTASAAGGSGTYEYRFWLMNHATGEITIGKDYSVPGNSWTWETAGLPPGTYSVAVWARNAGSTADWEAFATWVPYELQ